MGQLLLKRVIQYKEIDSPIGPLILCEENGALIRIDFGRWAEREAAVTAWTGRVGLHGALLQAGSEHPLLKEAERQLAAYFSGARRHFDLPLGTFGTGFQRSVWQALTAVPYGEVRSYKAIAEAVGNPKAVRAVGGANNKNPLPIVVPCHRVVGAGGALVGYAGGLQAKNFLLNLETAGCGVADQSADVLS